MKNKRIQYNGGGTLKLHKNFDTLDTSLNVQKNSVNVNVKKKLPKGVSLGASLNKVRSKSSTAYTVQKDLGQGFSIGVTKPKNQKPVYGITYKKNF
mgnify:CR=1 FL=1